MIILGVDPGLTRCGVGVVEAGGSRRTGGWESMLFDPTRHEPLGAGPWEEGRARAAIAAIVPVMPGPMMATRISAIRISGKDQVRSTKIVTARSKAPPK